MRVACVEDVAPWAIAAGRACGLPAIAAALLLVAGVSGGSQPAGGPGPVQPVTSDETFWRQPDRVAEAARAIAPGSPNRADVFFLGFAGDDSQDIFAREVRVASDVVARRVDPPGRSLLLLNNRLANDAGSPIASIGTLRLALEALATRMDVNEDVLFLYLTSHGLPSHDLYVANGDLPLEQIGPARLRELVDGFGFRKKIIVVSACYSGGFVGELADDSTVVLTAARADRPSFGCRDSRGMTYFGEALWQHAMQHAATLEQAFVLARERVEAMEREAGLVPSEPQMFVGSEARRWLGGMMLQAGKASAGRVNARLALQ